MKIDKAYLQFFSWLNNIENDSEQQKIIEVAKRLVEMNLVNGAFIAGLQFEDSYMAAKRIILEYFNNLNRKTYERDITAIYDEDIEDPDAIQTMMSALNLKQVRTQVIRPDEITPGIVKQIAQARYATFIKKYGWQIPLLPEEKLERISKIFNISVDRLKQGINGVQLDLDLNDVQDGSYHLVSQVEVDPNNPPGGLYTGVARVVFQRPKKQLTDNAGFADVLTSMEGMPFSEVGPNIDSDIVTKAIQMAYEGDTRLLDIIYPAYFATDEVHPDPNFQRVVDNVRVWRNYGGDITNDFIPENVLPKSALEQAVEKLQSVDDSTSPIGKFVNDLKCGTPMVLFERVAYMDQDFNAPKDANIAALMLVMLHAAALSFQLGARTCVIQTGKAFQMILNSFFGDNSFQLLSRTRQHILKPNKFTGAYEVKPDTCDTWVLDLTAAFNFIKSAPSLKIYADVFEQLAETNNLGLIDRLIKDFEQADRSLEAFQLQKTNTDPRNPKAA